MADLQLGFGDMVNQIGTKDQQLGFGDMVNETASTTYLYVVKAINTVGSTNATPDPLPVTV